MTRQPALDTPPVRCAYAARPDQRPHCQLTAVIRYDTIALCADCDTRRSTVGKAVPPVHLRATAPLPVLTWVTHTNEQIRQRQAELAAAVSRARTQGHTWNAIGAALNITRQAAQQRFKEDHPATRR